MEGLKSGHYDIGICTSEPVLPEINYIPLKKQELAAIVPVTHELAGRENITLTT